MTAPSKRKVLAITVASPLTQNIYDRIGAAVISEHFDVVVLDCLDWVRDYVERPVYQEVAARNIHKVDSLESFKKIFKETSPAFLLDFLGRGKYTPQIQHTCREAGALYITQLITPFPNPISQNNIFRSFLKHPFATFSKAVKYVGRQVLEKKVLPPDIALLAGTGSLSAWTAAAHHKIWTAAPNFFDLQRLQKQDVRDPRLPQDYILFIDDCLALSFDFVLGTYKPIFEVGEYFSLLNDFFSRLENHFGMPVVVAAHPNGREFENYERLFGDRVVLFNKTGELALGCRFAMTHFSSAISYPILLRKPLLLLNSKKIKKRMQGMAINYIEQQIRCPQVDIDEALDMNRLDSLKSSGINEEGYRHYEQSYITNVKTEDTNPFQVLIRYLNSLEIT